MHIHYLQHESFEGLANIRQWVDKRRYHLSATRLFLGEILPDPENLDVIIILGGPMNIYEEEKYPWLRMEKAFIKACVERQKAILGICLGAQLLADVLGGSVTKNEKPEIGWFPIYLTPEGQKNPMLRYLPQKFTTFHWHGDTFQLPPGASHLAWSTGCSNQAFAYGDRILGLQFHLEASEEMVMQLIRHCPGDIARHATEEFVQSEEDVLRNIPLLPEMREHMDGVLDQLAIFAHTP